MIFSENDILTVNRDKQNMPGFDERYNNIVDYILLITDDIWEKKKIHIIHDTYADNVIIHTGGEIISGIGHVINGTIKTLQSFPDRKMGAETVIWSADNEERFFSSHRIGSSATNLGSTTYGPATGKSIFFRTIADCAVAKNKIYEEWLVRDNLTVVEQLGFDPVTMARKETKYDLKTSQAYNNNNNNNNNNIEANSLPEETVIDLMLNSWAQRDWSRMVKSYHPDTIIHTIRNNDFSPKEHAKFIKSVFDSFPDARLDICQITSNNQHDITEIALRWRITGHHSGEGFFENPTNVPVMFYGISHYLIKDDQIIEEWCLFDGYDILCQIHAESELVTNGHDTIKKSIDTNLVDLNLTNKLLAKTMIEALNTALDRGNDLLPILELYYHTNVQTVCSDPLGTFADTSTLYNGFWKGILKSFPDVQIQPYILIGGSYNNKQTVSIAGNMIGTFAEDWLTIPANHQPTYLRFSLQLIMEHGQVTRQWMYIDTLSVIGQAGFQLFPASGKDQIAPIPITQDGIKDYLSDSLESKRSFDLVNNMITGLLDYDQKDISSMGMERFWDKRAMMWYGPSTIGTTRGLKGFQDYHQIPFLHAFPNRGVNPNDDETHYVNIGDGNYACHFGDKVMNGNHSGNDWLGLQASHVDFTMSVMDFWRRDGDHLVENWVMLDLVNVLGQLGIDIFKLLKDKISEK